MGFFSKLFGGSDSPRKDSRPAQLDTSEDSPITYHENDDPEIEEASLRARDSFKHFWKEVALDFNRIIPAIEVACVKVPFSDDPKDPEAQVEHMWVSEVDYDGEVVRGILMNTPNWLQSIKDGDQVEFAVGDISDWMCVSAGEIYGGYTVQVTRKRMNESERKDFDEAWGLVFPDPEEVVLPPSPSPFESVIAKQLGVELERDSDLLTYKDEDGRTLLHLDALYGRVLSVKQLLGAGADTKERCKRGWTPADYAKAAGWEDISALLTKNPSE